MLSRVSFGRILGRRVSQVLVTMFLLAWFIVPVCFTHLPERSPGFIKSQLHRVSQVHEFSSMSMSIHLA